jgi:hypothetical protein
VSIKISDMRQDSINQILLAKVRRTGTNSIEGGCGCGWGERRNRDISRKGNNAEDEEIKKFKN